MSTTKTKKNDNTTYLAEKDALATWVGCSIKILPYATEKEVAEHANRLTLAFCHNPKNKIDVTAQTYPHMERALLYAKKKLKTKKLQNDKTLYAAIDNAYGRLLSACCDYLENRLSVITTF